ncbi:UNVERIFIED_ORG: hypothetical protein J2S99_001384 [Atlantibacter hermannii]|nr:hypothetical protein [Atlantibacter hermannii]
MNISSALPGITRDAIIKLAKNLSIEVREQVLSRESRSLSDEVFMSGTAVESRRYAVPMVFRLAKVASARSLNVFSKHSLVSSSVKRKTSGAGWIRLSLNKTLLPILALHP